MKTLAIYPGSFDPPTLGHLDVVERAARLFDELIVAVGENSNKQPLLSVEQRLVGLVESTAHLPNVRVESFSGLLVKYALEKRAKSIVRGLRATADFEYEFQMAMVNRRLSDQVDTVFLMTKWEHSYLSSSIVREVALLGGDFSEMVTRPVEDVVRQALAARTAE
jgi:pantetheine-phosphate adenylyltransferase